MALDHGDNDVKHVVGGGGVVIFKFISIIIMFAV